MQVKRAHHQAEKKKKKTETQNPSKFYRQKNIKKISNLVHFGVRKALVKRKRPEKQQKRKFDNRRIPFLDKEKPFHNNPRQHSPGGRYIIVKVYNQETPS